MTVLQQNFSGGLNLFNEDLFLAENEYIKGFNIRSRSGALTGIKKPVEDFAGTIARFGQPLACRPLGLFSYNNYLFAVAATTYKDDDDFDIVTVHLLWKPSTVWELFYDVDISYVTDAPPIHTTFSVDMDSLTSAYWTEIPARDFSADRTYTATDITSGVKRVISSAADDTDAGMFVTVPYYGTNDEADSYWDSIGWFLTATTIESKLAGTLGEALNINHEPGSWTTSSRVYVPVGRNMAYMDGILYVVSLDRKRIYRSVTGRPLDFMVEIKPDGNKPDTNPGANSTAFTVSGGDIISIKALASNQLLVATKRETFIVTPNYTRTIFGEPTFNKEKAFDLGVVSQDAIADLLSDTAIITMQGIRTFNSILQLRNQGNNAPISKLIEHMLAGVNQFDTLASGLTARPCCAFFDNYVFFSVNTIDGYLVLVFDTLTQKWTSIDDYFDETTKQIRYFSVHETATGLTLWAMLDDGKIYQLFASTEYFDSVLYTRAICTAQPSVKGRVSRAYAVFDGVNVADTVTLIEYVDNKRSGTDYEEGFITEAVANPESGIPYEVTYPALFTDGRTLNDITFNFEGLSNKGWKFQYILTWPGAVKLLSLEWTLEQEDDQSGQNQQVQPFTS